MIDNICEILLKTVREILINKLQIYLYIYALYMLPSPFVLLVSLMLR